MININTILSTFDEKGTLLKWLKTTNSALKNASLKSVEAVQPTATTLQLKFIFADDSSLLSPPITLPKGEQGDPGKDATLPGYINFFSGQLETTSYDTNEFNFKAPFEMKSTETGEVLKTGDFNFKILIGGSDFIAVDLDESDSFLQIKLDETKVDTAVKEGSANLITSGAVFDKSTIIVAVDNYIEFNNLSEEEKTAVSDAIKKSFEKEQNMIILAQNRKKYFLTIPNIDEGYATFFAIDPDDTELGISVTFGKQEDGSFKYEETYNEKFELYHNYVISFTEDLHYELSYKTLAGVIDNSKTKEELIKDCYESFTSGAYAIIKFNNKAHLIVDASFDNQTDYTFYYVENGEIKNVIIDASIAH